MASGGWVAELDKKEHKNWVMVGCALSITKNGMISKIQKEMEAWYQSLISSPSLQSLAPCTCTAGPPKCATCKKWEPELTRLHRSTHPMICWNNSDRKQWGSPTGAWEIAKVFMPTLGSRKWDVVDAETTDIGGLLNLLEWCAFINPPLSRAVLSSARDKCRNHWAHAPKQELQDADVPTIFGHLNSLLSDPVFVTDKAAQKALKDLQDLSHQGLMNVRISEVETLHLLRQSLVADLTKFQDELTDVRNEVAQINTDAEKVKEQSVLVKEEICKLRAQTRDVKMTTQKDVSLLKEQGDLNKEEIYKLRQQLDVKVTEVEAKLSDDVSKVLHAVGYFNKLLNQRGDLEAFEVICDNVEGLTNGLENAVVELKTTKSQVANLEINFASIKCEVEEVANEAATNKKMVSGLQKDVMEVKEELEALKGNAFQRENGDDGDILCTAPSRLTSFKGRKSALEWLETNVVSKRPESGQGTFCCIKTICGLGGCGKTSLAVEFASSYKACFPGGVFWINGESDENIRKSVVEILALVNIAASTTENIDDTLNRFLSWLSKKKSRWLLVVDNADELKDSTCPTGVKKILRGPWQRNGNVLKHGQILFTTRENVKDTRMFLKLLNDDCLKLQCFSEEEGALFLMQRTGREKESIDSEAIFLAKELGALPLALEQAAAYISASPLPLSFEEYLHKYRDVKLRLLKQQPAIAVSVEAQHRLSIHTTWEMNFEYVKERSLAAAMMMRIAAFFESEYIPIELINPGCPELDQEELRDSSFLQMDISGILKVMSSYSLFSVDHHSRVFGVHKLVQEVVRNSLTTSERIKALVACIRVLRFALLQFPAFCLSEKSAKYFKVSSLSELKEEDLHTVVALLLNFVRLTSYMEQETKLARENDIRALFNDDTLELCKFVYDLTKCSISLCGISIIISDFYLQVFRMVRGDSDPNGLLFEMVNVSISKCEDCINKSKKLSEETMQKLIEFEKSGVIIEADVKYRVLFHNASYFFLECQFEKFHNALLEIEGLGLPLSDDFTVELQAYIASQETASNFESAFERLMNALKLARRIYSWNDPKLLRILEYLNISLSNKGKFQEARIYAKEIREIYMSLPPSDKVKEGMKTALLHLSEFNPEGSERGHLGVLEYRWPHIYSCVKDGYVGNCIPFVDDGSEEHLALILLSLIKCFFAVFKEEQKPNIPKEKLAMYRRIGEIFVSLRNKFYGFIFPEMEEALCVLMTVHTLLGTDDKEVFRCHGQPEVVNCQQGASSYRETYQSLSCDSNVFRARMHKDLGNTFFNSGDFSRALEFYNKALNLTPNDAKLSTNKAAAYVKLSKRHAQNQAVDEQRKFLEYALQNSNKAITADPFWVKGYYWRAVCLAKLERRGPSLASAAVAKHLSPSECSQIPAVVETFESYSVRVVSTVRDLHHATDRTENNLIILVEEGRYELPNPLKAPTNAVIVGLDEVQITCTKGVPLQMDKTNYIENITLSPTMESMKKFKEKAKECLNRGELATALSEYSKALTTCPNNPQLLTTRAITYVKSAEQKKDIPSERKALLELAVKDCEVAIKADPSWLLSYSTKAESMAKLDRKHQALAAAAVFKHFSSGHDIAAVTQRYGGLQIHVVDSSDELDCVLQGITELEGVNQVVLIREGEYVVEKSVQIEPPMVVVGLKKVTVSCKTGPPFHFMQGHFVENVELCRD